MLDSLGCGWEVILVNDASRDESWSVIRGLTAEDSRLRGIDLMRNYGQHNALLCGIREAQGDVIVTMDDDLQHPPEEIPKLLDRLQEGFDVVYGTPEKQQHGVLRDAASYLTKLALQNMMGAANARNVSAFRAFRTPVRQAFAQYSSPYVSLDALLTWGTAKFSAVRVRHDPRRHGTSNYTVTKLVTVAVNLIHRIHHRPAPVSRAWLGSRSRCSDSASWRSCWCSISSAPRRGSGIPVSRLPGRNLRGSTIVRPRCYRGVSGQDSSANHGPAGVRDSIQNRRLKGMVGARGFEPPASWSRTRRSTRLSHAPKNQQLSVTKSVSGTRQAPSISRKYNTFIRRQRNSLIPLISSDMTTSPCLVRAPSSAAAQPPGLQTPHLFAYRVALAGHCLR